MKAGAFVSALLPCNIFAYNCAPIEIFKNVCYNKLKILFSERKLWISST